MNKLRIVLCVLFVCSVAVGLSVWRSEIVLAIDLVIPSQQPVPVATPPEEIPAVEPIESERPDATAVFTNSAAITIPALGNGSLYPSPIVVSGLTGNIANTPGSVTVTLHGFSHTFPNDVGILLVSPEGGTLLLQNAVTDGNAQIANNVTYTISDDGATALPNSTALTAGTFKPASYRSGNSFPSPGPLLAYNTPGPDPAGVATLTNIFGNAPPNGTWNLFVVDFVSGDAGSISGGWTLTLTVPGPLQVNKTADTNDGACTATDCSLREAITAAAPGDTITFSSLFNSAQTITLNGTELFINKNLTINGPGANLLTVSGNNSSRVFQVGSGSVVSMSGLKVRDGNANGDGGGIFNDGTLTLNGVEIFSCVSLFNGGGIGNGSGDNVTVTNSLIVENGANVGGGVNNNGTFVLSNSTVSLNVATINGGGINNQGTLTVTNSTIAENTAVDNNNRTSGIFSSSGSVNIRNTIVAANLSNATKPDVGGVGFTSNGFNLIGNRGTVTFGSTGDQSGTGAFPLNPRLGNLSENGGPTDTYPLRGGSPALDKGSNSGSPLPTGDQRGFTRIVDLAIANASGGDGTDIGAFESATIPECGVAASPIAFGQTINGTLGNGDCHLTSGGPGTLYDAYTFTGTAGQQIAISMNSAAFNAILFLHQGSFPGGTQIAVDNNGGGGTNARIPAGSGFFTLPATGTFTIVANAGGVSESGAYTVNLTLGDTTAPTAVGTAPNVTTAGATSHTATVVYTDNVAINASTVGIGDIRITGPNGFDVATDFQNVTPGGNGSPRTANYPFPVSGGWTSAKNGTYNIVMQANQVADTSGNFVATGPPIGTFTVNIPASPQTFTVTNLNNEGPGSLRAAIETANANSPAADTINFQAGLSGTITLAAPGELVISDNVTINGPGVSVITVSGGGASRVFNVGSGLTLIGLTITGGNALGSSGGGILVSAGNLILTNSTIAGNSASSFGGGINVPPGATATITNSTVSGNTASIGGGMTIDGTGSVTSSTISGNTATSASGAGGGLDNEGNVTITNSTITGNQVPNGNNDGGGIVQTSSSLSITNCTITNNSAAGLLRTGGSTITIRNSIIAGNQNNAAQPDVVAIGGTGITSNGFNLIGNRGSVAFAATGDQSGTGASPLNPLLGPLANNGGPTQTHALLAGSPAIDKGSNAGSGVTTDQRGLTRPRDLVAISNAVGGDGSDIGAYEEQNEPAATPPTAVGTSPNVNAAGVTSQTVTVT